MEKVKSFYLLLTKCVEPSYFGVELGVLILGDLGHYFMSSATLIGEGSFSLLEGVNLGGMPY